MNIKKIVINSLLLAIGAILHQITPPLVLGMKPDFYLTLLFIIIILNDDYKTCLCCGIVAGLLSAASTTFPGGQLPNIIDKFITTNVIFLIMIPFRKILNNQIKIVVITAIGTIISGFVFLTSASIMVGLPGSFRILFLSIVIPACAINTVASIVLFNAINIALKSKRTA
ncbi:MULTISPECIES: tryptophan transporter [Clostridium]|uniref:tryptophan transporter n=1 Tax=Clostridium TaxID=1485 RepID=UPI00069DF3D8|nr:MULTISPECIES: tryptophan transporter [Clostridium]KOF56073.1 tryptophan transporter [Clostridium sp. DMHC 10]MCD2345713.1 tryptophan transporter [Clostridium guangxiense]